MHLHVSLSVVTLPSAQALSSTRSCVRYLHGPFSRPQGGLALLPPLPHTPRLLRAKDAAGMAQLTPPHRVPCLWKPTEHGCWDGGGWHRPSGNAPVEAGSYTGAAASATSSICLHHASQHPVSCSFPQPQGTRRPSTSQSHTAVPPEITLESPKKRSFPFPPNICSSLQPLQALGRFRKALLSPQHSFSAEDSVPSAAGRPLCHREQAQALSQGCPLSPYLPWVVVTSSPTAPKRSHQHPSPQLRDSPGGEDCCSVLGSQVSPCSQERRVATAFRNPVQGHIAPGAEQLFSHSSSTCV